MNACYKVPQPANEPALSYGPGSPEKRAIKAKLVELRSKALDIPLVIGGKEVRTGRLGDCRPPHDHARTLGRYHKAGPKEVRAAVEAALKARREWAAAPCRVRAAVFLRAAELVVNDWRWTLNGATMLAQSKSVREAEIDSACEVIDLLRFNAHFAQRIHEEQPLSARGAWNVMEYRPLEGFVLAVSPFNFTSIASNLAASAALMGNVVVWKPASSAVYTAHHLMALYKAAGLPDGVINMVCWDRGDAADAALSHPDLAGVNFTGSPRVFDEVCAKVGTRLASYRCYPRLVGESGGKDFIVVHPSADLDAVAAAMVRGAFEYQGQKCSAASRAYVPDSMWRTLKKRLGDELATVRMGPPEDFRNFCNAVIDRRAFDFIKGHIARARKARGESRVVLGGSCDDSVGYYVAPTVVEAKDPGARVMTEEIFGPVLTVYVYPERRYEETLRLCDRTSPFALTGAVMAQDRKAIERAREVLVNAVGNFYVNDKPTGAVVGQQPFGGARRSGTNVKTGSIWGLLPWVSPLAVKENLDPPRDYRYPFLAEA